MITPPNTPPAKRVKPGEQSQEVPWEEIRDAIQGIRFGTVQLIIQDGRVIQIDKTVKIRLISP